MRELAKYAILDTDFVSKANLIRSDESTLADEILSFPGYKFFYHQMMEKELDDHGTNVAKHWLQEKKEFGAITCYDDQQIISELVSKIGVYGFSYYRSFLKTACDMKSIDFYLTYFSELDRLIDSKVIDENLFLSVLLFCESKIGRQKSYGEIKAFVLLEFIRMIHGTETYIFCSDDRGARLGFANNALVPCISILSVFIKLWLMGKSYDEVKMYYQSFIDLCSNREKPQTMVKVWAFSEGTYKRKAVCIEDVLSDIYSGKYEARKDGDLQLKR